MNKCELIQDFKNNNPRITTTRLNEIIGYFNGARVQIIKYTNRGRAYLVHHGTRYYFDDFIRSNYMCTGGVDALAANGYNQLLIDSNGECAMIA